MATVTAGMTVSLDGFVADRQGSATRLYPDLADLQGTDYMDAAIEETGAVVMGRRTFEMADPDSYVGNYEFQVPIFVVTHHPPAVPPRQDEHLTFTFVTDGVDSAIKQAKTAAGDKVVQVVGGPNLIQRLLDAGLVDELRIDVMPVVLGDGLRLLENLDPERLRLEKLDVREVGARTSLGFRVVTRSRRRAAARRATHIRLVDVEDAAPANGFGEHWEARVARTALGAEHTGVTHFRLRPGKRSPFTHRHVHAEEIYVILSGSGRIKLDDEFADVRPLDAIRVAPQVARAFEAGPEGLEFLAVGPHHEADGEPIEDAWTS